MNATELADELLKYSIPRLFELDELIHQSATMLRTIPALQAEIEALKAELEKSAEVNRLLAEDIGYEE